MKTTEDQSGTRFFASMRTAAKIVSASMVTIATAPVA